MQLRKNNSFLTSWLVIFIAIFSDMGICQNQASDNSEALESALRNFANYTVKGLGSFSSDVNFAIPGKLNDMTPKDREIFDFIVVGAGSAGSAVAGRLSEMKNAKILLIEAGVEENILMDVPLMGTYVSASTDMNWNYAMEPSEKFCRGFINQTCKLARGKVMGGCSTINYMVATRGHRQNYDDWAKKGCFGWSYLEVLPFFKKLENLRTNDPVIEWGYHNVNGPLHVTEIPAESRTQAGNAFLQAGVERGFPIVDYDGTNQIGYSHNRITVKNGMRFSSNRAYLHSIKGRQNLYVTKNSQVEKVLIDNKKQAYGVLFTKNGRQIEVLASKEIIICAGAINSPQILMLSGIGPAEELRKHHIPILKAAPVGENLMDHFAYGGLNFVVNDTVTISTMNITDPSNPAIKQYVEKREGVFAIPVASEGLSFFDVDNLKNRNGPPNIQIIQAGVGIISIAPGIDKSHLNTTFGNVLAKPSYMLVVVLVAPKSRGKVLLRSNNPFDEPIILPNYLEHPDDMKRMILGIREAIRLSKTSAMQKFGSEVTLNPIIGCEDFKIDSDDYWDCAIRTFGSTSYHPAGTCKMGAPNDPTAVVDPRLKVIGIRGLRVADASIMPEIVTGHPNVPIIMIGEKLAQMVKEDWRFKY